MLKLCLHHRNVLNLFSFKKLSSLMFRLFGQLRVSYHKTLWYFIPSLTLLFIWNYNFDKFLINILECVIQFYPRLGLFQMKIMASKRKYLMWKIADIVAISSRKHYAAKYRPFKNLHFYTKLFKIYIKMCKLIKLILLKLKSILTSYNQK